MTFIHPWVLIFLVIPIVLAWAHIARRPGIAMPFDHRLDDRSRGPDMARRRVAWRWSLGFFEAVPLLLLAVAIVVAAGPQMLKPNRQKREITNIQICMDVSGSMLGPRYENASRAITEFTKMREGDEFGLILFGSAQIRWVPLTKDLQAIRDAMPFADPSRQPMHMSGTSIGAAMMYAKGVMEAEADEGDRMIVVVSDGQSSDFGDGFEYEVADALRAAGIVVYYIHVAEEDIPLDTAEMARETGGDSFAASDAAALDAVFKHIDRMRKAKLQPAGTSALDHFAPFAIAALALLGLHGIGLLGVRYTPW